VVANPSGAVAELQQRLDELAAELRRRTAERDEALAQQRATAEVLQVINASPGDLKPVFEAMLDKALALCDAAFGVLWRYDGGLIRAVAIRGATPEYAAFLTGGAHPVAVRSAHGRLVAGADVAHLADVADSDDYLSGNPTPRALVELGGGRSLLALALRKDGKLLGTITVYRQEVRPFTEKQIDLLQSFAAQAVIAMENARLITETREALEQQQAIAEVLQVINFSPGDLAPVFQAILEQAHAFCEASFGALMTYDGQSFHPVASQHVPARFKEFIGAGIRFKPEDPFGCIVDGAPFSHIEDLSEVAAQYPDDPLPRAAVDLGGIRTLLVVPLRSDNALLGIITAYRQDVRVFTEKQICLLQSFAAQAVIAMENARLITETRAARDAAEQALAELKTVQASLIQAEKMASLGQLTAGIAHEIKNPLNFVNNFAGLSVELLDELKTTAAPGIATLDIKTRAETDELVAMLTGNLEKIIEHGRRADGIVKSMLEHSRGDSGERRAVDLNRLVDEALNLAYHGARARDQNFNIVLERDFDRGLALIELAPQDITRVFLNLFSNGFHAVVKRQREGSSPDFRPVLKVTTRELGEAVEIRVRDNGVGIAPEISDKLFQPFFTTKPAGEGTGLGLSISYDIVTGQHGGSITVDSEPGAFTEFTVRLPRHGQVSTTKGVA